MADITYCSNTDCDNKSCERHHTRISKAAIDGKGYVSVSDFAGICREYIHSVLLEVDNNG